MSLRDEVRRLQRAPGAATKQDNQTLAILIRDNFDELMNALDNGQEPSADVSNEIDALKTKVSELEGLVGNLGSGYDKMIDVIRGNKEVFTQFNEAAKSDQRLTSEDKGYVFMGIARTGLKVISDLSHILREGRDELGGAPPS